MYFIFICTSRAYLYPQISYKCIKIHSLLAWTSNHATNKQWIALEFYGKHRYLQRSKDFYLSSMDIGNVSLPTIRKVAKRMNVRAKPRASLTILTGEAGS